MRLLNGLFVINAVNSRLNGSSQEAESFASGGKENKSYTKKIKRGKNTFPYASGQCQKFNIKEYAHSMGFSISPAIATDKDNQSLTECNPAKNYDEDIMGYMGAIKDVISEDEYNKLSKDEQDLYKKAKDKKNQETCYSCNKTKKRKGALQISTLQAVAPTQVVSEFCTKKVTGGNNNLYSKEVYSTPMSAGFNLDIERVGKFLVSEDASGYRDYVKSEIDDIKDEFKLEEMNGILVLPKEERFKRIQSTLYGITQMAISSCQGSNLTDTSAKMIILAEYDWGNNLFIDLFKNDGSFNIDGFKETLEFNEMHRLSPVWIGVKTGFNTINKDKDLKTELIEALTDFAFINVTDIKTTVDGYLEFVERVL
jgi:CRISPR-associated protein Cst2